MSRPTESELAIALKEAIRLRESGQDYHYLAKALLNLHYRMHYMEAISRAAGNFLHSGLAGKEQADLQTAINKAEKAALKKDDDDTIPIV